MATEEHTCNICGASFDTEDELEEHNRQQHEAEM